MENIISLFSTKMLGADKPEDVFQSIADTLQFINKDVYSVCLTIDFETFELLPVRDLDRILFNNIKPCIEKGICGQLLEPDKVSFVKEQSKFSIYEKEYALLLPIYYNNMQYGMVIVFFPVTLMDVFEKIREDLNGLCAVSSKMFDLMKNLEKEKDSNAEHVIVEGRLNNIVQNVVHGLIALDNNNDISIFNKNAEIIFGISSSAVVGKPYREAFSEKLVRTFDLLLETTLIEGSILDYQVDIEIAPGVKIPVGISSSVLVDNQGVHQGIICVCRDMSLTKEVNRLKELDQMKSEFVSMVSHELKNPIAIIKSSIETFLAAKRLGKSLGEEFEKTTLESINDEINRLAQLINDILNLSRIEAGKIEIKKEMAKIEHFLMSATHMFKTHEKTHPVKIIIDESANRSVLLDQDKIKQVVINYVGNAIKYSPNGCEIEVKAFAEDNVLKITVSDNGIGIPDEKKKDVFQKFSRISTPETEGISGTGLGLSICKKIVELHKGQVWFESEYHKGSTFGLNLPISTISTKTSEAQ